MKKQKGYFGSKYLENDKIDLYHIIIILYRAHRVLKNDFMKNPLGQRARLKVIFENADIFE